MQLKRSIWITLALAEIVGFGLVLFWRYGDLVPAVGSRLVFSATMLVCAVAILVASWLQAGGNLLRFALSGVVSLGVFARLGYLTWVIVSPETVESWPALLGIWALLVVESLGISAAVPWLLGKAWGAPRRTPQAGHDATDPA